MERHSLLSQLGRKSHENHVIIVEKFVSLEQELSYKQMPV